MIVDVHTHTPRHRTTPRSAPAANAVWRPDQTRPTSLTWDEQMAALDVVDRRPGEEWVLMYATPAVNDDTAAFARAHPEKLIGFLTVHPHDPGVLDEIERATQDLGLRGIKLGPNHQNIDPLEEAASR